MRRVLHLMRKELIELRDDPRLFGIVIVAPILQLTVLGYAATTDVKDVPVVVVDADRSVASRELVARFDASDNFTVVDVLGSTDQIDRWLERGDSASQRGMPRRCDGARPRSSRLPPTARIPTRPPSRCPTRARSSLATPRSFWERALAAVRRRRP
jgi:ABC-2 type transport system permease protein